MTQTNQIPTRFKKPLVIITGASSGIGEATALYLARSEKYSLMLCGRDETRLLSVVEKCRQNTEEVIPWAGDLRDRDYVTSIAETAALLGCYIYALVNAAGLGFFNPISQLHDEQWDEVIGVNLTATFLLSREVAKLLEKQDGTSTIVNVSSDADTVGFADASIYCASKGGVLAMSRALQLELRPHGIRVCVVSPGRVDTCFNNKKPGMRPGALLADNVAEVINFAISCSPNIELQEIRLDSMSR